MTVIGQPPPDHPLGEGQDPVTAADHPARRLYAAMGCGEGWQLEASGSREDESPDRDEMDN